MNYKMDTLRNISKCEELSSTSIIPSTLLARATRRTVHVQNCSYSSYRYKCIVLSTLFTYCTMGKFALVHFLL